MFIELNIKTKRHTISTISIIESQDTRVFFLLKPPNIEKNSPVDWIFTAFIRAISIQVLAG